MATFQDWFPYHRDGQSLFAFAHAGAGPSAFTALREHLAATNIGLVGALPPGRGRRIRERPHRRMESLLAEFADVIARDSYAGFQSKYGLLGNCSGALIAYEVARLLVAAPCPNPAVLVVCSCLPPQLIFDTGVGRLPTSALLEHTASMGGTDPQLLDDPDFRSMLERPLRADWELFDAYRQPAGTRPLPVPVLAVRGGEDPNCEARYLAQWRATTSAPFRTAELAEGHWALEGDAAKALAAEIAVALGDRQPI